ncbi:MAG TPA: hypothetical protein VND45_07380 [Thermoanaerobaculia bacterium]|jgi:hypothetical protein|nr:hypothetical protein [Thermoanaerobaculia bacterium]
MVILGILLPSLLLAWAVRRWVAPVPWRFIALFMVLTLAFLHGAVFTSKLPVPVDEVARGYPYKGVVGAVAARNPLTNDTARLFLPWMQVAREELFAFRAPLWNRYSFSGYPLLGNGESAPFSPLFLATLFVPLPQQIVAMAGLKLFVALLFGYLFARRSGAGDAASCFAASAFAFSVFQTVFLYYSTTAVTAFLPAALYALLEAQEHARRRDVVLVALIVATLMANGHPESVLHIAIGAAGLLLIDVGTSRDRMAWLRRFRVPSIGAIAGLALSAPAWVPVLEQVRLSSRLAELRAGHAMSYPLTAAWAMISPNGFGNPVRQNWGWILNYSLVAASYVGLLVLAFFAAAVVSPRTELRDRLWALYAILSWLIALGWTPIGRLFNALPPFSITANDKLRFVALFIAAVVAAKALERIRAWYVVFAVLCAGAAIYVYTHRAAVMRPWDLIAPAAVLALMLVPRRFVPAAAAALLTIELFVLNGGFNALVESRYYKPRLPIVEELHRIAPHEPYRIAALEWMFLSNASAHYGLEDVRGSDPMSYAAYTELLKPIVVDDRSIDFDRIVDVQSPLLDALNVRYLLTEPGAEPGGRWQPRYRGPDGSLFENPSVRARFWIAEGEGALAIEQRGPARFTLRVNARTPLRISSSQGAGPGWRVRGGEGVRGTFLGVAVPDGRHTVEVAYRPLSFWGSVPIALFAAVLLVWNSTRPRPVSAGPDAVRSSLINQR